jgi:hypothetical protein
MFSAARSTRCSVELEALAAAHPNDASLAAAAADVRAAVEKLAGPKG